MVSVSEGGDAAAILLLLACSLESPVLLRLVEVMLGVGTDIACRDSDTSGLLSTILQKIEKIHFQFTFYQ